MTDLPARAPAPPRLRRRRDTVGRRRLAHIGSAPRRSSRPTTSRPRSAACVDPDASRSSTPPVSPSSSRGSSASPRSASRWSRTTTRPSRYAAGACGRRQRWRALAADGAEASDALRRLLERLRIPLVGHEVKPVLVAGLADDPALDLTPIAFDTQIAAYILERGPAQPDHRRRRGRAPRPDPAARQRAARDRTGRARGAVRARRPRAAPAAADRDRWTRPAVPRGRVAAHPGPRPYGATGVALDQAALAVLHREFGTEIARLETEITRTSGTSSTSAARSNSSRCCSSSLDLPKGARPRQAIRRTRRSSRSSAQPTR